jgi:hypothetical protein
MPYYSATVRDKKPGSKHRRKMTIEATNREQAKIVFNEKCTAIGFMADLATLKEITRKEYEKKISTLLGKHK